MNFCSVQQGNNRHVQCPWPRCNSRCAGPTRRRWGASANWVSAACETSSQTTKLSPVRILSLQPPPPPITSFLQGTQSQLPLNSLYHNVQERSAAIQPLCGCRLRHWQAGFGEYQEILCTPPTEASKHQPTTTPLRRNLPQWHRLSLLLASNDPLRLF
jgi:hypothetical protein